MNDQRKSMLASMPVLLLTKKTKQKKLHLNHTFMNKIFQLKIFIDLYLLGIK